MQIINLTPHKINIYNEDGKEIMVIEPSGTIAKIKVERERVDTILGIPIFKTIVDEPENLPIYTGINEFVYIVSGMIRAYVKRSDFYQPGELLRNDEGQPIGCIGLSQ
jgi:hypothetical protein